MPDPYETPRTHKDRSGPVMRVAIIAALLGVAAWGYMQYSEGPDLVAEEPAIEQQVADSGYTVTPTPQTAAPAAPATPAPAAPAPQTQRQPAAEPQPAVPPPSTTIGGTPG